MTGQQLYELWRSQVLARSLTGFHPTPWQFLTDAERGAWDAVAFQVPA